MLKTSLLTALMVAGTVAAHADLLEVSGFGGYTTLGMKQVNSMLASPKTAVGYDQTTTTDISNGYVVGLDVRSGTLIPIPFVEIGLRGEYIGANGPGEAKGTWLLQPYDVKEEASMVDAMLGLTVGTDIPVTGLNVGVSVYGGYGEGALQQSSTLDGFAASDPFTGGAFVGEAEAHVRYKLFSVLGVYAFGGMRLANLGVFSDPAKNKLNFPTNASGSPDVDFSGLTGGLGLNLDF